MHALHPLLQLLYLWSELLYRTMTLFFCAENSSTHNSWPLFKSPISWILPIWVSWSAFSFMTKSSCSRTCSLRDSAYPKWASSNRWAQVFRWSSLVQVLRDPTLYSCFMSPDLAPASKWSLFPSRRDFATFTRLENLKNGSLLPKTCWWTGHQVSFLVQSDKLAIVLHLLLAPVGTVVKPPEHEVAHRLSPIPGAVSQCFRHCDRLAKDQGLTRKSSCSMSCLSSVKCLWSWLSASCPGS